MLFNSISFVIFFPAVLIALALLPARWRNAFILIASYFFYGCWDYRFLLLLMGTTVIDYWVGIKIADTRDPVWRKRILFISLTANLTVLGFFKYFNFFIASAEQLMMTLGIGFSVPMLSIVLPVGVSFYTFQSMSYTIDVYRGVTTPSRSLWSFALYVAYFPQLVAGPISRKADLLPRLEAPEKVTAERVNVGLMLILLGLVKKVLIADMLAPEVARVFGDPSAFNSGELLRGVYYFTFQIYCDFAGYSDIARGASAILGVDLCINFNQPYLSQSITEFWRRWHISLSSWLRDYLYIPLGGNRHGELKTYRNLMLTMLIGGLWHGANWTFVAWGGLHGTFLAVERMLGIGATGVATSRGPLTRWLVRLAMTVLTFHLATLGWVFFRAPTFGVAYDVIVGILAFNHLAAVGLIPFLVGAAVLAMDIPQNLSGDHTVFLRLPWWVQSPAYATACLALILYGGKDVPFIYFQF